ncbi:MAG TPA: ATP-dependent 6-phosphofructokinase [Polyangiaceae bacterium]|nr:ATP-dependent 6-phosphofructokinase [Polyangiaceae bacterium]
MGRRIAVNTGGGDAPGLNAVIRAVVLSAQVRGWDVLGIRYGYRGLIQDDPNGIVPLDADAVRGITHLGGTILGSTNRGDPFNYPLERDGKVTASDVSARVVSRFKELGIDALVALGGDGSLKLCKRLLDAGIPRIIAVPKTIDNDLPGTDITFGFETAVATATEALEKLHSTAEAHERVMVVEVMGRHAGWIALHAGVAGSADVILIPEIPYDLDLVCEKIMQRERNGRRFSIVVVAEGTPLPDGAASVVGPPAAFSRNLRLGGIAQVIAEEIAKRTRKETRSLVLGHLQRGGSPVTFDRLLALRLGTAATRFLAETDKSGMVAIKNGEVVLVPLEEATGNIRTVPQDSAVVATARDLGVCFGDEAPGSFSGAAPSRPTP